MPDSIISPQRTFVAFLLLTIGGGAIGAAMGVTLLAVLGLIVDGRGGFPYVWDAFAISGLVGALLGAILAPLTGFTVLRRVPLGKALALTGTGTALGAAVGLLATNENPLWAVGGALSGYAVSAAWLRSRAIPSEHHEGAV